jgi:hypothetical protein
MSAESSSGIQRGDSMGAINFPDFPGWSIAIIAVGVIIWGVSAIGLTVISNRRRRALDERRNNDQQRSAVESSGGGDHYKHNNDN